RLYKEGKTESIASVSLQTAQSSRSSRLFKNIDGVKMMLHEGGCGGTRQDAEVLCSLLAGYIHNPNVAGATILSLGCQNAEVKIMQEKLKAIDPTSSKPVIILDQQQSGTEQELL